MCKITAHTPIHMRIKINTYLQMTRSEQAMNRTRWVKTDFQVGIASLLDPRNLTWSVIVFKAQDKPK